MRNAFILLSAAAVSATALAVAGPALAKGRGSDGEALTRAGVEAQASEAFARLDVNRDGVLSPADREAKFAEQFAEADTDGNGQLSLAEASAARDARRGEMRERVPENARGDEPRSKGRDAMHSLAGIVRGADADGDRQISQAEFNTAALARFDRADTDSDGTISRAERRDAMRAAFGAKRTRSRD